MLAAGLLQGLYAERIGALNVVLADKGAADRALSQLKRIARSALTARSNFRAGGC